MNISWLEDFLALASTRNFSRAADLRHMTQPAFGRRIRALEEWLGTSLFDRSTQPVSLTETGEWFRTVAQNLLAQVGRLPDEARAVEESWSTTLRFAATHTLSFTFMPNWLRSLEPRVTVGAMQCVSDMLQRCENLMLQGKVQFVMAHAHTLVPGQLEQAGYPSIGLGDDMLMAVSGVDGAGRPLHGGLTGAEDDTGASGSGESGLKAGFADTLSAPQALDARAAANDGLRVGNSAALHLLTYSAESGIGRILQHTLGAELDRLAAQTVFTAHLASVLKPMALAGRGIAWLPRTLISDDLQAGRLVPVGPAHWQILLQIRLYRDRAGLGRTGEKFWEAISGSEAPPARDKSQ